MTDPWTAEVSISAELARSLIAEQFPQACQIVSNCWGLAGITRHFSSMVKRYSDSRGDRWVRTCWFIVIVAAFGITCTLITFVMMKTREIGLMKAVGASNRQVMPVFVAQSVVISVLGIGAGLGLGLFALHVRNDFLHFMNHLTGRDLFSASIYGFGELPAMIVPGDIAIICGGSLVICLVAAILPARHASKMKTVEALRHE